MKHLTRAFSLLLLVLCLLLSACATRPNRTPADSIPNYVYTETLVSFDEPSGRIYQDKCGWETTQGTLTIRFTSTISEEERNAVVFDIVQMVAFLQEQFSLTDTVRTICIHGDTYAPGMYQDILYSGISEVKTQDFAAALVQFLFGVELKYGLCYAIGTELALAIAYPTEALTVTVAEALSLCDTAPQYLDMNYACFLPQYAEETTREQLKVLALDFYRSLTHEAKIDLITNYSHALFRQRFNEYLVACGQTAYENADLDAVHFYPCGGEIRLAWEDPYARFYLYDDYTVAYGFQGSDIDYVNSGYDNLRYLAICYYLQATEMEQLVGHLESEDKDEKVPVLFIRDSATERYAGGGYFVQEKHIKLFYVDAYAHEYVHYVTRGASSREAWQLELLPCYCTQRPGHPMVAWNATGAKATYEALRPDNPANAEQYAFYTAVINSLDHPFNWDNIEDFIYFYDVYMVAYDQFSRVKTTGGLVGHGAFAYYLASLVGEQAMMDAIYYDTPVETFGKSWDALISDWEVELTEKHGWIRE